MGSRKKISRAVKSNKISRRHKAQIEKNLKYEIALRNIAALRFSSSPSVALTVATNMASSALGL